jgi:hypothetical protein
MKFLIKLILLTIFLIFCKGDEEVFEEFYFRTNLIYNSTKIGKGIFEYEGLKSNFKLNSAFFHNLEDISNIKLIDTSNNNTNVFKNNKTIQILEVVNSTTMREALVKERAKIILKTKNNIEVEGEIISSCTKRKKEFLFTWKIPITAFIILSMLFTLFLNLYKPYFIFIAATALFIILGIIQPRDLLDGFANEAMITNGLLFPIVKPISSTNFIKVYCKYVFGNGDWPRFSLLKIMLTVAVLSFFLNNTPIVALFIPIIKNWCTKNNLSPSKFLIPLSYATIVGGMSTLIVIK